ncbi:hypothetical protein L665_04982 [Ralstonia solanacearum SD54]|nr:transposase [Ralstonia solanacearum]ESS51487.1 hypothetical protein L665_04982 [Ralstonia solanacearum SD54]
MWCGTDFECAGIGPILIRGACASHLVLLTLPHGDLRQTQSAVSQGCDRQPLHETSWMLFYT